MKHKGKAAQAARRIILLGIVALGLLGLGLKLAGLNPVATSLSLITPLALFTLFTLYFFRDPDPQVPSRPDAIVAPAHGKVDLIDETVEEEVLGGRCRRISIFLSVFDVHVQQAPVGGEVTFVKHTPGKYLNAMSADCADHNENLLLGLAPSAPKSGPIAVRLITGLIARRIVPWVTKGDIVAKGERISLIQFGSRVNLYLPLEARLEVKLGDRVVGGETVLAQIAGT